MTNLHWRIIGLLAWLTFLFNIDLLSPIIGQSLPLQNIVITAIGAAAVILPLLPQLQRRPLIVLMGLIAFLYAGALLLGGADFVSRAQIGEHLLGLLLLMITTTLSYRVALAVLEFRRAIESITFSTMGSRLRSFSETNDLVDIEMARSRRFERPLSLVMIQADASSINMQMHRLVQEVQRGMMQRYVLATMARVLSRALRRTDLVVEDGRPGRLLLVAPETNEQEASLMGARVTRIIRERLGISSSYGIAAFPHQALTFEDMCAVAEKQLQHEALSETNDVLDSELLDMSPHAAVPANEQEPAHV